MTESVKVSVILTSYNHEKYLREAIESTLHQSFSDFELIIWDDASTNSSPQIIESYTDPRIKFFRNDENRRAGYGINKAIREGIAKGEYVAIHHSDDVWEPEKLEKQVAFLDSNPQIGAIFTWAQIIDDDGQPFQDDTHYYAKVFEQTNRTRYDWLNYFFYHDNALCHPSVLIRKKCYDDVGLYRRGMAQVTDFDMWIRLCLKHEIYILPEKLVRFRVHANEMNTSGSRPETRIRVQFEYLQILENYISLSSLEEFLKVFPLAQKYVVAGDFDNYFALGMISLEAGRYKTTELFGLLLLFEALNDPLREEKLQRLYGFGHIDLIELTAMHDIFSVEKLVNMASLAYKVNELELEIRNIHNSRVWRAAQYLQNLYKSLIPTGSFREKILRSFLGKSLN